MGLYMSRRRILMLVLVLGLAGSTMFLGRGKSITQAQAAPPAAPAASKSPQPPASAGTTSDYDKRVVAIIQGAPSITREDLGEYLIARMGADRLNNLVNQRIIQHAAQQQGIDVTPAEIEADFADTLKSLNLVSAKDFEQRLLKPYQKTLYEWKEDVIKPRLLLTKMCRENVKVTEEDIRFAFEAHYGEKVECRMIMWPKDELTRVITKIYPKLRENEDEFDRQAKQQASGQLAATGGKIRPIGRNTTGNPELEKVAFALKPGELSRVVETPEGAVVLKCDRRIPPDTSKSLDNPKVRQELSKEVYERKVQAEIPKHFSALRDKAQPRLFIKTSAEAELRLQQIREEAGIDAKGSK